MIRKALIISRTLPKSWLPPFLSCPSLPGPSLAYLGSIHILPPKSCFISPTTFYTFNTFYTHVLKTKSQILKVHQFQE